MLNKTFRVSIEELTEFSKKVSTFPSQKLLQKIEPYLQAIRKNQEFVKAQVLA
jgi:hypothetical protein